MEWFPVECEDLHIESLVTPSHGNSLYFCTVSYKDIKYASSLLPKATGLRTENTTYFYHGPLRTPVTSHTSGSDAISVILPGCLHCLGSKAE